MSYGKIIKRAARILKGKIEDASGSIFTSHEREMADFDEELKRGKDAASDKRKREESSRRPGDGSTSRSEKKERPRKPGEMTDEECCRILGVSPSASAQELKGAYRNLIAQYHPDKVAALGNELQQLAAKKTREINEAYQTLRRRKGF